MFKKIVLTALVFTGLSQAQNSIGLDINSDDVEVLASYNFNETMGYTGGTEYHVDFSYLHNDLDDLVTLGLSAGSALEAAPDLHFSFGFQLAFAEDFVALPLFAKVAYLLPLSNNIPNTTLSASFAYAPSVLTFSDGDTYSEFRTEADMEVISNIHIFLGYRNIETNYEFIDYTLSDSFYGGLKLSF
ncbi:MAG: hypothetical protein GQ531_02135 [Sulfurovum sp.]|nr:hypothetical protein [Sulfurovum sp.]